MKLDLRYLSAATVLGFGFLTAGACGGDTDSNISSPTTDSGGAANGGEDGAGATGNVGSGATAAGGVPAAPPADFVPDRDNDTEIADLTDDEFQELCDEVRDYAEEFAASEDIQEFQCRATGITVALTLTGAGAGGAPADGGLPDIDIEAFREECQSAYDQCIDAALPGTTPVVGECQQPDSTCDVTVGEVEECLEDLGRIRMQLGNIFPSCESATVANLLASFLLLENASFESASCEALNRCDMGGSGGAGAN